MKTRTIGSVSDTTRVTAPVIPPTRVRTGARIPELARTVVPRVATDSGVRAPARAQTQSLVGRQLKKRCGWTRDAHP